jgi:hypothetical protein
MSFMTILRSLLQRRRAAREIDDELAFHLDKETQANLARGMTPAEARLAARRELRGAAQTREKVQEVRMLRIESVWQDVRLAARALASRPRFTLAASGMLALAIGLTTAMFTVVDALVLRPVPFPEPAQLALLHTGTDSVVPAVVFALRESPAFEAVESALPSSAVLETGDTVVARGIATVTPGVFEMLGGVRPLQGRLFHATEGRPGDADRVLVSETLWRTLYGADPALIGRTIGVDGERLTVVGILPDAFRFPSANTVLWRPTDLTRRDGERARPFVRLRQACRGTMPCGSRPTRRAKPNQRAPPCGCGHLRWLVSPTRTPRARCRSWPAASGSCSSPCAPTCAAFCWHE